MVSDVTRMGEWSPVCRSCRWDDGEGPWVGAWFTGHNVDDGREWDTHCEVLAADPGREFAFGVAGTFVRWTYTFATATDAGRDGAMVTETWEPLPDLLAFYAQQYGEGQVQSTLDATGNGTVKILSQNDTADGWRTLTVSNWVVTAGVSGLGAIPGWLHSPQTDPPTTTTSSP